MIADPNDANRFTDKQTDKRVHELLVNENDTVSEKDISNIKTDVAENLEEKPEKGKKIQDNTDPEIDTVWNIEEGDN